MSKWFPCIHCTEDLHCLKYSGDGYESWCVLGPCSEQRRSHGDEIRAMTDEEQAEWIVAHDEKCRLHGCLTKEGYLDWLRQEATR